MNQDKPLPGNFNFSKEVKNGRIEDNRGTLPGFERGHEVRKKRAKKPPKAGQISRKPPTTKGV